MDSLKNIRYLLHPRSIAILGCSEKNVGGSVLENLLRNKYAGNIYPVHPRNTSVFGVKCYTKLADIPDKVDACLVALRSDLVLSSIEEMHEKGVPAAVFLASGFSEIGPEGKQLEEKISRKLAEYKIAACGPNCLGLINVHEGVTMYSAATDITDLKGRVGIVSHSGSVCISFLSAARGEGFSYIVSCGNEAGLTVADYFRAMIMDDKTEVIVGFLEAIRDPEGLKEVAKLAVQKNKPIIVLKVGKSEIAQETAAAHSGAMASSSDITDAFFKQNHILQANSFDEINEACELLLRLKDQPVPKNNKVGMTAISGGQLAFCADAALQKNVEFGSISEQTQSRISSILPSFATAKNPLDVTTALFEPDQYQECIRALAADDDIGLMLICQDAQAHMYHKEVALYRRILQAICEVQTDIETPLAVFSPMSAGLQKEFSNILLSANIPLTQGAHQTMHAVKIYFEWMRFQQRKMQPANKTRYGKIDFEFTAEKNLSEHESKELLSAYGINVAKDILVKSPIEAVKAANEIGYPVVLKVDSPDILHKTEAGIIKLNVNSAEDVCEAYDEIMENARAYNKSVRINGVSVQEMVSQGVEILLGGKCDPIFGASVLVGIGGIFVEIFRDYSLALAPVDLEAAYRMINSLKGKELLYGARGTDISDVDALADALVKLSRLMHDHKDRIQELDINPLVVLDKGVKVVDALVVQKD